MRPFLVLASVALLVAALPLAAAGHECRDEPLCVSEQEHPVHPDCTYRETRVVANAQGAQAWAGGIEIDCGARSDMTFIGAGACVPSSPSSTTCQSVGWMDTMTPAGRFCSISNLFLVPCPPVATPELAWGSLLP